ncbi:hypothetical protein Scep_016505 [Stephania cephalantha]|uniref:Uncharacterized protein n=1 Tax=Stephania cephalantha TaxID=152367 RepID=A0AAP0IPP3_9MAGN
MAFCKPSILAKILMVVVLVALASDVANASTLTVWRGPGCTGPSQRYSRCGCYRIPYQGGYSFQYTQGQPAWMYMSPNCRGNPVRRFGASARSCSRFPWTYVSMQTNKYVKRRFFDIFEPENVI